MTSTHFTAGREKPHSAIIAGTQLKTNAPRSLNSNKPVIERVRSHHTSNGLTVLTLEDHTVPVVTSMIWYRVGSRYELPGATGLSHLLEHMMFKGSAGFAKGEIDSITTRHGGANNAFTSNDYTAYYFSFASDRWWPALEIEADRMQNAVFDPREFELERRVVIEELKTERDDPWGALRRAVEHRAFSSHPYRFPVLGRYRDLMRLTPGQLLDHYRRYYCPANATLVVAGDFSTPQVLDRIQQLFGAIASGRRATAAAAAEVPRGRQLRFRVPRATRLPRILVALPSPPVGHDDHYALHVADKILAEGKLSRLYRRLVEKAAVAANVAGDFADTFDPYLYAVSAELLPGVSLRKAEDLIFDELHRMARRPPGKAEMRRAQNQCVFAFLSGFETTLDQAFQLGLMETLDRPGYWVDYADRIGAVTSGEVASFIDRYMLPEHATIGVLRP